MIPLVKESTDMFANTHCYERCYFCNDETDTWHKNTNQPVCKNCAGTHKVSELAKCTPNYKPKKK